MGKKKSKPKKPKPLLSLQGILHLQSSFIHPTQESGLLTTVGGLSEQGLVLAPNYGYGIPASALEASDENRTPAEESVSSNAETKNDEEKQDGDSLPPESKSITKEDESNPDDLSVAELVRHIGGAKGKPILQKDVVEDRERILNEQVESVDVAEETPEDESNRAKTDEFYASIGMPRPEKVVRKEDVPDVVEGDSTTENNSVPEATGNSSTEEPTVTIPDNVPESVADYYKTLNNYYYSAVPDPLGDDRLEFGSTITSEVTDMTSSAGIIQLARIAQKRKRAMEAAMKAEREAAAKLAKRSKAAEENPEPESYDPLPMEIIPSESTASLNITAETDLKQYWEYVRENPHDFNRWTYLVHYAENTRNLNECRQVYSSFLPLFPYCFGYWKRYCELEKGHHYFQRALTILLRGLDFNPLCIDLWLAYLNLFCEIYAHSEDYETIVREQYEKALSSAGMDFRSDALWDAFIDWELNQKRLKQVFLLYLRLLQVPTRLYNRHWDNVQALIRDHHPRDLLSKDYYEKLRKKGCKALKFRYKLEPEIEQGEIRKTSKPEDELMNYVKSIILERLTAIHNKTLVETDKRWDFEDLIKRPYFHVKPLDKRQLHNWEAYLNFEIQEGNHDRIILLFERCVTACAQYESFWCRYARYVEKYHKKNKSVSPSNVSIHLQKSQIDVEIVSEKQTEEEETLIADVDSVLQKMLSQLEEYELVEVNEIRQTVQDLVTKVCNCVDSTESNCSTKTGESNQLVSIGIESGGLDSSNKSSGEHLSDHSVKMSESPLKSSEQKDNFTSSSSGLSSLISLPSFPPPVLYWHEIVRDIYKRACVIHCARKPTCRLQWAAFEEEIGNPEEAKKLILHVIEWFSNHFEAKLQLIELERRRNNFEAVEATFEEYLSKAKNKDEFSTLAIKYARFLSKEISKSDKALLYLRKAAKKDKSNPRIYGHIYELVYERFPVDRKGPVAALQIAMNCKDLTNEQRLIFAKKMVHFLQEHGDLRRYRDAIDQFYELQAVVQEEKLKERKFHAYDVPARPNHLEPFPVPDWASVLAKANSAAVPIEFETDDPASPSIKEPEQDQAYKEVAPTKELLVGSDYGYGSKHPDYKIVEKMSHSEYEKLESKGYPEHLLDKNQDPATLSKKRKHDPNTPVYIVAPKGSYLLSHLGGPNTGENPPVPGDAKRIKLDPPVALSMLPMPTESPCINVPDWFVKEGGELCLSETPQGFSMIRYWPHFLSETGNMKMFRTIRRCVKWHQKQHLVGGRWRHLTRLVSWLGPCNYNNNGLEMPRNENWPPEILDLLHRIIQMTRHEFNSCFLNLYRTGHDNVGWHSDSSPALGANPPIASVSLGTLRLFELRRRGRVHNFIRFPLFPGSLLLMEGATQEDWSHQVPKEPLVKDERVNLTFRIMHAIDDVEKTPGYKPIQPKAKPSETETTALTTTSSTDVTSTVTAITSTAITTTSTSTTTTSTATEANSSTMPEVVILSSTVSENGATTSKNSTSEKCTKIIYHKK